MGKPKDQPRTGNGKTGGRKPKAEDCVQRLNNGVPMIEQPSKGWAARLIRERWQRKTS